MLSEFGEIGVVVRFGERSDALGGSGQRIAADQMEYRCADLLGWRFRIENNDGCVAELQCRGVEVSQRA
jgi:hypothetical protein